MFGLADFINVIFHKLSKLFFSHGLAQPLDFLQHGERSPAERKKGGCRFLPGMQNPYRRTIEV